MRLCPRVLEYFSILEVYAETLLSCIWFFFLVFQSAILFFKLIGRYFASKPSIICCQINFSMIFHPADCDCNNQASQCHVETGRCFCTTKGIIGDHCEKCDTQNHYHGDPTAPHGSCFCTCFIKLSSSVPLFVRWSVKNKIPCSIVCRRTDYWLSIYIQSVQERRPPFSTNKFQKHAD